MSCRGSLGNWESKTLFAGIRLWRMPYDFTAQAYDFGCEIDKRFLVMEDYPDWSCQPCGDKHGSPQKRAISSWHYGRCDVCGKNASVTQPRDFGHFKNWFSKKKP